MLRLRSVLFCVKFYFKRCIWKFFAKLQLIFELCKYFWRKMQTFVKFLQNCHLNSILWVFLWKFGVEIELDSIQQNGQSKRSFRSISKMKSISAWRAGRWTTWLLIDNRRNSKKMKSRTLESTALIFGEITSRFKPMRVSLIKIVSTGH